MLFSRKIPSSNFEEENVINDLNNKFIPKISYLLKRFLKFKQQMSGSWVQQDASFVHKAIK